MRLKRIHQVLLVALLTEHDVERFQREGAAADRAFGAMCRDRAGEKTAVFTANDDGLNRFGGLGGRIHAAMIERRVRWARKARGAVSLKTVKSCLKANDRHLVCWWVSSLVRRFSSKSQKAKGL